MKNLSKEAQSKGIETLKKLNQQISDALKNEDYLEYSRLVQNKEHLVKLLFSQGFPMKTLQKFLL